jgi:hypothetical protein
LAGHFVLMTWFAGSVISGRRERYAAASERRTPVGRDLDVTTPMQFLDMTPGASGAGASVDQNAIAPRSDAGRVNEFGSGTPDRVLANGGSVFCASDVTH